MRNAAGHPKGSAQTPVLGTVPASVFAACLVSDEEDPKEHQGGLLVAVDCLGQRPGRVRSFQPRRGGRGWCCDGAFPVQCLGWWPVRRWWRRRRRRWRCGPHAAFAVYRPGHGCRCRSSGPCPSWSTAFFWCGPFVGGWCLCSASRPAPVQPRGRLAPVVWQDPSAVRPVPEGPDIARAAVPRIGE